MSVIDHEERNYGGGKGDKYNKIRTIVERTEVNRENARKYIESVKAQVAKSQLQGSRQKGERFYVYMSKNRLRSLTDLDIWLNQDGIRTRAELIAILLEMYLERDESFMQVFRERLKSIGPRGQAGKPRENNLRDKYEEAMGIRKQVLSEQAALNDKDIIDIFDIIEESFGRYRD